MLIALHQTNDDSYIALNNITRKGGAETAQSSAKAPFIYGHGTSAFSRIIIIVFAPLSQVIHIIPPIFSIVKHFINFYIFVGESP